MDGKGLEKVEVRYLEDSKLFTQISEKTGCTADYILLSRIEFEELKLNTAFAGLEINRMWLHRKRLLFLWESLSKDFETELFEGLSKEGPGNVDLSSNVLEWNTILERIEEFSPKADMIFLMIYQDTRKTDLAHKSLKKLNSLALEQHKNKLEFFLFRPMGMSIHPPENIPLTNMFAYTMEKVEETSLYKPSLEDPEAVVARLNNRIRELISENDKAPKTKKDSWDIDLQGCDCATDEFKDHRTTLNDENLLEKSKIEEEKGSKVSSNDALKFKEQKIYDADELVDKMLLEKTN